MVTTGHWSIFHNSSAQGFVYADGFCRFHYGTTRWLFLLLEGMCSIIRGGGAGIRCVEYCCRWRRKGPTWEVVKSPNPTFSRHIPVVLQMKHGAIDKIVFGDGSQKAALYFALFTVVLCRHWWVGFRSARNEISVNIVMF